MGCHNRVQFPSQAPSEKKVEHTTSFFFWGLAGETSYELYEDCPSGNIYEIYAYTSPSQIAWNFLTLGIYSPRTIEVTCSGKTYSSHAQSIKAKEAIEKKSMEKKSMKASKPAANPPVQKMQSRPRPFDLN